MWYQIPVDDETYDMIAARALALGSTVELVADAAVARALTPDDPARPWARLHCARCARVEKHRWTGHDPVPGGFACRYRCVGCYARRHFGYVLLFSTPELLRLQAALAAEQAEVAQA